MKHNKKISAISAFALAFSVFGAAVPANAASAAWTYIGGNPWIGKGTQNYWVNGAPAESGTLGEDGCLGYFDNTAGVLYFKGTGTIAGADNTKNGTALFCPESEGDLTINIAEGSEITLAGADSTTATGLYVINGSL